MERKINYFALIAAVLTFVLIAVSIYVPWWQVTVGKPALAEVNFSPVNLNMSLLGNPLSIPLLWAVNLAATLTLTAGGIVMLIYSVMPTKSYAKHLLGFGYKQPLYALILFIVELVVLYGAAKTIIGFDFPMLGSTTLAVPQSFGGSGSTNVSVVVSSAFMWPFFFAIVVVALCIVARLQHKKVIAQVPAVPAQTTA